MSFKRAERPLTCVFDLDSIVVDLHGPWLGWYNKEFGDNLQLSDLTTWHVHDHVKPECGKRIYEFFADPARYAASPLLPGAKEGLAKLHKAGHRIVISTATGVGVNKALIKSENDMTSVRMAKLDLIEKAAPFIDNVHIGQDKFIVCGDVFIDDSPANLQAYKDRWPQAKTATIAYPYNENIMSLVDAYALSYQKPRQAWDEIVNFIMGITQ